MAIEIKRVAEQGAGAFDGGKIEENKPVAFPQEAGGLQPFSTLFYWAHAWSKPGGLIDLHPHRGFEILSYVIKGTIEHYDTLQDKWLQLEEGGLQIIRSGTGVQHAERFTPDTEIFQIWFDPDLMKSLQKPASYDDYVATDFQVKNSDGLSRTILTGDDSPVKMDAPATMERVKIEAGSQKVTWNDGFSAILFAFDDTLTVHGKKLGKGDVVKVTEEREIAVESDGGSDIFLLTLPAIAPYHTYVSSVARQNG